MPGRIEIRAVQTVVQRRRRRDKNRLGVNDTFADARIDRRQQRGVREVIEAETVRQLAVSPIQ